MSVKLSYPVIGLRDATVEDIAKLKAKYPRGAHVTHRKDGVRLSYNGVFYTKVSNVLKSWARL